MLSHIPLQRADSVRDVVNHEVVVDDVEFTDQEIQDLLDFIESLNESSEEEVRIRWDVLIYYMGWKVSGFLMKTSVFWAKLYLFLNIVAFEGEGIAIF